MQSDGMGRQKGGTKIFVGVYLSQWCHVCGEKVDVVLVRCACNFGEEPKVFDLPLHSLQKCLWQKHDASG